MREGLTRCPWVIKGDELYEKYHDTEWGVPVYDDRKHFEFLVLESAQAGLSWITILRKREGYRQSFANFDPKVVALFTEEKVQELLRFTGIVRNQAKIRAAISNAQAFLKIQKEFGSFTKYIWQFVNGKTITNNPKNLQEILCQSPESLLLSKDLKKRGFKFLGPKILYSHMQATGLINDHTTDCFCHNQDSI
jgi:DNA-3-methyladenine glycosylase I